MNDTTGLVKSPALLADYAGQWVGERVEWAVLVTYRNHTQGVYSRSFDESTAREKAKWHLRETAAIDTEVIRRTLSISEWERNQ